MNIDRRWILPIAVTLSAVIGAAFASRARRQQALAAAKTDIKDDLKTWENEGGNLAQLPLSTVQLAVHS
jgi:hypothetical protein